MTTLALLMLCFQADVSWDANVQGIVLAAFFYGYIVTQAPGRALARAAGGKRVMLVALIVMAVLSLVTPKLTQLADFGAIAGIRAVQGLAEVQ